MPPRHRAVTERAKCWPLGDETEGLDLRLELLLLERLLLDTQS